MFESDSKMIKINCLDPFKLKLILVIKLYLGIKTIFEVTLEMKRKMDFNDFKSLQTCIKLNQLTYKSFKFNV